jgi:hypothetical protein
MRELVREHAAQGTSEQALLYGGDRGLVPVSIDGARDLFRPERDPARWKVGASETMVVKVA